MGAQFIPKTASQLKNVPAGSISATDVQAAINELDIEKAPALGADDNYVTDAEKIVIGNTSGTNTGDETTTRLGSLINSATEKTTPVDADMVGLMDSAASNVLKKLSWVNIKATLKTYFDTLYYGKFKLPLMPGSVELVGASTEPLLVGIGGTNLNWSELRFNDTTVNRANWFIPPALTANYAGGNITIRLRWKAAATTGAVVWQVQLLGRTTGEQIDTAMETARTFSATTVNGTTELTNNSELTFTPTAAELTAGDAWIIRIIRLATDAGDTMSGDAKLFNAQVFEV